MVGEKGQASPHPPCAKLQDAPVTQLLDEAEQRKGGKFEEKPFPGILMRRPLHKPSIEARTHSYKTLTFGEEQQRSEILSLIFFIFFLGCGGGSYRSASLPSTPMIRV